MAQIHLRKIFRRIRQTFAISALLCFCGCLTHKIYKPTSDGTTAVEAEGDSKNASEKRVVIGKQGEISFFLKRDGQYIQLKIEAHNYKATPFTFNPWKLTLIDRNDCALKLNDINRETGPTSVEHFKTDVTSASVPPEGDAVIRYMFLVAKDNCHQTYNWPAGVQTLRLSFAGLDSSIQSSPIEVTFSEE